MNRLLLVLAFAATASAQVAATANEHYRTEEARARMVITLSDPARAQRLQAGRIIDAIGIQPGMTVADIGAGAGVVLPYLAKAVGPSGRVLAQDIFADFLAKARETASRHGLANVTFIQGTEKDPRLPATCCDLAVAIDAYHHFDYPAQTLAGIDRGLKPDGRLVVVDYYKRENAMGEGRFAIEHIRLDMDDAIREIEANGFRLLRKIDHNPGSQWLAIFGKQ